MFSCKFKSGQFFKNLIDTISNFIEDGTLIATPNGLELTAIERSRIAMIDLFVSKDKCVSYECDKDLELNINFNDLSKFVTRSSGDEEVSLTFIDDENKLQIKLKGNSTRTFSIPLLEQVTCESIEGVNLESDVEINLEASTLAQAIKDSNLVADVVDFEIDADNNFSIFAKSDRGTLRTDLENKPDKNDSSEKVKAKYSLDFLTKMLKAGNLSSKVAVKFSTDQPIILNFLIDDDPNSGKINYFLAPQVEEEEDYQEEEEDNEEDEEDLEDPED